MFAFLQNEKYLSRKMKREHQNLNEISKILLALKKRFYFQIVKNYLLKVITVDVLSIFKRGSINILAKTLAYKFYYQAQQVTTTFKGKDRRHIFEKVQYTAKEIKLIEQFRKIVYPLIKDHQYDNATLLRYLYSGDLSMNDAYEKFKMYHQWMTNQNIQTINQSSLKILKEGAIYTFGRDRKHRPIVFMNLSIVDFNKHRIEDYYSAINALLNVVIKHMFVSGVIEKYLFVIDMAGKGFTSLPFDGLKAIIQKLSTVYSLRLGAMLVLNTNYFIKLSYRAVSNFISEETTARITLLTSSEMNKLLEVVDPQQLQIKYGGKNHNIHCHWPPKIPHIYQFPKTDQKEEQESQYYSILSVNEMFNIEITQSQAAYCCSIESYYCAIY